MTRVNRAEIARRIMIGCEDVIREIDELPHRDRVIIRQLIGDAPSPRNLWYDYQKQEWID